MTDSAFARLLTYTSLTQIIFSSNQIESLDTLKTLSSLRKLQEVEFIDNPVSLLANYRTVLFDSYLSHDLGSKVLRLWTRRMWMECQLRSKKNLMKMISRKITGTRMMTLTETTIRTIIRSKNQAKNQKRRRNDLSVS